MITNMITNMLGRLPQKEADKILDRFSALPSDMPARDKINIVAEMTATKLNEIEGSRNDITIQDKATMAASLWKEVGLVDGMDEDEIADRLRHHPHMSEMMSVMATALHMVCLMKWVEHGLPVVKVSPKYAAAAVATRTAPEVLKDLKAPWRAFIIELPKEAVIYMFDDKGVAHKINRITVAQLSDDRWTSLVESAETSISTWRVGVRSEQLGQDDVKDLVDYSKDFIRLTKDDEQTMTLVERLIVSVVCGMTNQDHVVKVNSNNHKAYEKHNRRSGKYPTVRVYQINEPIELDLVETVREYQLGSGHRKGHTLSVQSMVAGHRKLQPHGPAHSLRKTIWVHPYWRGPEDGKIAAVRPRTLK